MNTQSISRRKQMTETELAEFLEVSRRTVQGGWRFRGNGPRFRKVGSAVRYDPADVDAWLSARERTSTSDPGPAAA